MGFCGMAASYLAFSILHFFQFVLAITVCGLYGVDLHQAQQQGKYQDGKWVYAEVLGSLSAFSAVLLLAPFIMRFSFVWVWNAVLFFLWIVLFAIFGNMFIRENPEGNSDIQRMKNAVWVDLASALLWFFTTIGHAAYWWRHRERKTRFTGRAKV